MCFSAADLYSISFFQWTKTVVCATDNGQAMQCDSAACVHFSSYSSTRCCFK